MPTGLIAVEAWNVTAGCALDDSGNPIQMLSIRLGFEDGAPAETATIVFQGERGGPGVGSLIGSDLYVEPDPGEFANYLRILKAGHTVGAYVALDDKGQLLSFFLAFSDTGLNPV
jgi:hypothetical protein